MGDILAVGSASVERMFELSDELRLGKKQTAEDVHLKVGGSGVNYACRLLAMGRRVRPLLVMGEDEGSKLIKAELSVCAGKGGLGSIPDPPGYSGGKTPTTTVIIEPGGRRTVINEKIEGFDGFAQHAETWLEQTINTADKLDALMVGHIPTDSGGKLTGKLIARFKGKVKEGFVLLNPGRAQYKGDTVKFAQMIDKVDCLQLASHEAQEFAAPLLGLSPPEVRFADALDRLSTKCQSVVITFGGLGAVGKKRGQKGGMLAYP
jgi:sugar/nucleoside kinase (ribokinase family)